MSNRILAMGIAESVDRMTPPTRKHAPRRRRIGAAASVIGWLALTGAVLTVLRAFA